MKPVRPFLLLLCVLHCSLASNTTLRTLFLRGNNISAPFARNVVLPSVRANYSLRFLALVDDPCEHVGPNVLRESDSVLLEAQAFWLCNGEAASCSASLLLSSAVSKLSASSAMGAGDSAPLNALGDVLQAAAELAASSGAPHATSQALLQRALDEGFLPALRLRRDDADALAGVGECRLALSRAAAAACDAPSASQHAAASADAYERALRTGDASHLGSVTERCEVQYNFACACVLSRDVARRAVAVAALEQLAAAGATSEGEIRADADLAALREL